jgi:hypothetical protein
MTSHYSLNDFADGDDYARSATAGIRGLLKEQRLQNPPEYLYNERVQNYYLQMPLNIVKKSAYIPAQKEAK